MTISHIQSRSGGLNANEIEGVVTDSEGRVIHSLFGKWNEALYLGKPPSATCIWRASEFKTITTHSTVYLRKVIVLINWTSDGIVESDLKRALTPAA